MKVIITGATGMVGRGVLRECLVNPIITDVLVVGRKSVGIKHDKLIEIIHEDFFNLNAIEEDLAGYDACFFCLGVSSFRMNERDYSKITYELTLNFAKLLADKNPNFVFNYVSGAGTDATEKGNSMWARVKGKTENDLKKLPYKRSFAFRPGIIKPEKSLPTQTKLYKLLMPLVRGLYPIVKWIAPNAAVTTQQIALAMIYVVRHNPSIGVLESKQINQYSQNL